jgi:hypothetical protein
MQWLSFRPPPPPLVTPSPFPVPLGVSSPRLVAQQDEEEDRFEYVMLPPAPDEPPYGPGLLRNFDHRREPKGPV